MQKACAILGEGTVNDQMYQKWTLKCHAGDFLLDNSPHSDKPVKVDSN